MEENGREVRNNEQRGRRGRIGQRRAEEECRKNGGTWTGIRRENERRTKRKKKGGEWEERKVLFDINSHVI